MDWFWPEGFYTLAMIAVFVAAVFLGKLPIALAMALSAVVGALVSGNGIPLRHLAEGEFGYLDPVLVIVSAMIFMKVLLKTGLLDALSAWLITRFSRVPAILSLCIMLIIMIPGMLTGSSTTAVLTTGALVAPVLMTMGLSPINTASVIALGAIIGMIAPPVCLPAMIICGGTDIPYVGFTKPLLFCTFPLAALYALTMIYPKIRKFSDAEGLKLRLEQMSKKQLSFKLVLPVIVLVLLIIIEQTTLSRWSGLGMPLIFLLSSLVGFVCNFGEVNVLDCCGEAVDDALPIMGVLMAVGMFIQIMTLNGAQGFVVVSVLSLPSWVLYLGMAVSMPLLGAVSSFASSSVLGVPFLLALLKFDSIIVASALSLIISLGDMVPPAALAGRFSAQVVGEKKYSKVFKNTIGPGLLLPIWGLIIIFISARLAKILL